MKKITDLSVRQTLVPRALESYKGTFGHVLVVAGNEDMGVLLYSLLLRLSTVEQGL